MGECRSEPLLDQGTKKGPSETLSINLHHVRKHFIEVITKVEQDICICLVRPRVSLLLGSPLQCHPLDTSNTNSSLVVQTIVSECYVLVLRRVDSLGCHFGTVDVLKIKVQRGGR